MFDVYIFAGWLALAARRWRKRTPRSTAALGLAVFVAVALIRWAGKARAERYAPAVFAAEGIAGDVRPAPDYYHLWGWNIHASGNQSTWRAFDVIGARVLDGAASRDPRRVGLGYGGP